MMNDQQREAAARELCRLRGVDPEGDLREGDRIRSPAWMAYARDILAHEQMQAAIAVGMASGEPPSVRQAAIDCPRCGGESFFRRDGDSTADCSSSRRQCSRCGWSETTHRRHGKVVSVERDPVEKPPAAAAPTYTWSPNMEPDPADPRRATKRVIGARVVEQGAEPPAPPAQEP